MQIFYIQRHSLIRLLNDIPIVHFSFDMWTSANYLALLGVVGHWINLEEQACRVLLGLQQLHSAHTEENQGHVIFFVLQEFRLSKKVGYFTLDNASNNDTALQFLYKHLQEQGISFDPLEYRLLCIGYMINLAVKAFLYDNEIESICGRNKEDVKDLLQWRTRGPYG